MKKNGLFGRFAPGAFLSLALLAVSSCGKEEQNMPSAQPEEGFMVNITAESPQFKSHFGNPEGRIYPVLWDAGQVGLFSLDGAAFKEDAGSVSADFRSAEFSPVFTTAPLAAGGAIYGFSPKGNAASGAIQGGFTAIDGSNGYANLVIPAEQTPLAGSPDPAAQPLYGSATYGAEGVPVNVNMSFKHVLAYGKMKITGYAGGDMAAVSIKFPVPVAGDGAKYYFRDNGSFVAGKVYQAGSNAITVNPVNVADGVVWFALAPTGVLSFGELQISVSNAAGDVYVKSISLPTATSLAFNRGQISAFTADFTGIAPLPDKWVLVKNAAALAAGDVLVLASNEKGFTAGALDSQVLTNVSSVFSADKSEITSLGAGTLQFTLGGSAGAWTLSTSGGLLGATAAKKLAFGSGTTSWSISIDADGKATVQNNNVGTDFGRFLYNVNSPRFTTYTSAANVSMLLPQLYRKTESTLPGADAASVTTGAASAVTASGATLSASYSGASALPYSLAIIYGKSEGSLASTAWWNDAIPGLAGSYSVDIESLEPATTYYYRAVVQVGGTDFFGAVRSFTTLEAEQAGGGWLELPEVNAGANQIFGTLRAGEERNYSYLYDKDYYCPLWSAYPLYSAAMGSLGRPSDWDYNPNIPAQYQISVTSNSYGTRYGASQYSRGHHVPNADRNGNSTMQNQTFYVSNQSPQLQNKFNASIWSSLEGAVRNVANATDTVYVVTGASFRKVGGSEPITYLTAAAGVTPAQVPVPNYFWKVLLKVRRSGADITSASAIGVWLEHKEYSSSNWQNYTVSVSQIETYTGFNFFAALPASLQSVAEANNSWTSFQSF